MAGERSQIICDRVSRNDFLFAILYIYVRSDARYILRRKVFYGKAKAQ